MPQDTIFLMRCYNLATHFNTVKQDLVEPENAHHERLFHLCDAFLTPELLASLNNVIRNELHDLQAAQVHTLAAQTLPLLAEINEMLYGVRWSGEDIEAAQRYLLLVADKLIFESFTKKVSASEFIRTHLTEIRATLKNSRVSKKKFLADFARKHGKNFDASHLLREFNELNRRRK